MQFSLLNTQTITHEFSERNSIFFYRNKYDAQINIYTKILAQKEYTKILELLLGIFYFYCFSLKTTKFKSNILSSGLLKKEQVHRSILSLLKIGKERCTIFSINFQNFLFLTNMIYTNFYNTNFKYLIKKNRFFRTRTNTSCSLFFTKINHISPLSVAKVNKSKILRMNSLINLSGFYTKHLFYLYTTK